MCQAHYRYARDPDSEVGIQPEHGPATWGFLYTGGLFADAKRRQPDDGN